MNEKYQFLTHAPVHRVIGTMAFPTIISMLLTSVYNLVDTFFVGQIDTQSTAAVGIVFSVMFFIQAFSFFFGNGSGNYISRQLGAQKVKDAETMASTGLFYTLVFSILTMLIGFSFFTPSVSSWAAHPPSCHIHASILASVCWAHHLLWAPSASIIRCVFRALPSIRYMEWLAVLSSIVCSTRSSSSASPWVSAVQLWHQSLVSFVALLSCW